MANEFIARKGLTSLGATTLTSTLAVTGTADLSASGLVTVNLPSLLTAGTIEDVLTAGTLTVGTLMLTTTNSVNPLFSISAVRDGNTIDLVVTREMTDTLQASASAEHSSDMPAGLLQDLLALPTPFKGFSRA